ncbi:hypothetical protein E3983_10380 [Legionella israelensis]|uniref:Uncharacterized protein n=1 Tax=Legionella israelensis TaxID=454 RepID=A0AAX1EHY9_9GAMM|nr:hypothetical protein [Legionella israelensis]QBR84730.1 hypothetical protein E3983_10380 [Legionella israelensis]
MPNRNSLDLLNLENYIKFRMEYENKSTRVVISIGSAGEKSQYNIPCIVDLAKSGEIIDFIALDQGFNPSSEIVSLDNGGGYRTDTLPINYSNSKHKLLLAQFINACIQRGKEVFLLNAVDPLFMLELVDLINLCGGIVEGQLTVLQGHHVHQPVLKVSQKYIFDISREPEMILDQENMTGIAFYTWNKFEGHEEEDILLQNKEFYQARGYGTLFVDIERFSLNQTNEYESSQIRHPTRLKIQSTDKNTNCVCEENNILLHGRSPYSVFTPPRESSYNLNNENNKGTAIDILTFSFKS